MKKVQQKRVKIFRNKKCNNMNKKYHSYDKIYRKGWYFFEQKIKKNEKEDVEK